ncbi:MAG: hypothetical protein JWM59_3704 [Verrucomicrobiales bacterium]|nr:hypothetical protein [Verrucomicrobiales bacterium]
MKILPLAALITAFCTWTGSAAVQVEDIPEGGVQPQVAIAADGTVHLVYLKGEPKASEVRWTWRKPGAAWQPSQTVNTLPGSAVAMGTIRGPQLALGAAGALHVVWNGAGDAHSPRSPLWYASKAADAKAFGPQRDLLGGTTALDGGASVAADGKGRVLVAWHGNEGGGEPEESQRLVFVVSSADEGRSFGKPEAVNRAAPGVCACCSLAVTLDPDGDASVFFRSAESADHRAMTLLSNKSSGWKSREIEPWKIMACPMSSATVMPWNSKLFGAWETAGKIRAGWISEQDPKFITIAAKTAKHPVAVANPQGRVLVAWVEGTGWNQGGMAAWQEFDAQLQPVNAGGRVPGVPAWGRVAAYAGQNGDFVVLR